MRANICKYETPPTCVYPSISYIPDIPVAVSALPAPKLRISDKLSTKIFEFLKKEILQLKSVSGL